MNNDVLLVSFSAFFADLGYQTAIALFPIFLVVTLSAPVSYFGIANAFAFGIGSFFGYFGGLMSDRFNDKYVAILGNALIPLISLMGLAGSAQTAVWLFAGGWWARNFRTPSRRDILVEASSKSDRGKVFGFLHALDIGGGLLSVVFLLSLIYLGLGYRQILLLTVIPLVISTLLLFPTSETKRSEPKSENYQKSSTDKKRHGRTYNGIIIATALYGFSSFSLGFPILTIAQKSGSLLGIGSYGVYLGVSSVTGYYIGSRKMNQIRTLGLLGYVLSGIGSLILALAYLAGQGVLSLYFAVALMGFALGVIETLEPTLISFIKGIKDIGKGMGALAASRSFGIFFANIIMGLLYVINPADSYFYAAIVSAAAGIIVLFSGKDFKL